MNKDDNTADTIMVIAVAAALLSISVQRAFAQAPSPTSPECKVAEEIVLLDLRAEERRPENLASSAQRRALDPNMIPVQQLRDNLNWKPTPPPKLIDELYASPFISALDCANVIERLKTEGMEVYEYPKDAPARMYPPSLDPKMLPKEPIPNTAMYVLPSVSADGRHALMVFIYSPFMLGVKHFVRTDGVWKERQGGWFVIS
jgi:hypothetical protein